MKIDKNNAWIENIYHNPSPNYDQRPIGTEIELLVIHAISLPPNEFGGQFIDQLFTNSLDVNVNPYFAEIADLRVSSHLLIRRNGDIIQYVSLQQRAWHAGVSNFAGRERCNDFSIGIELEGCDSIAYTNKQYQQLIKTIKLMQDIWPILTPDRIVGHCDIAPGRKTDPGPFFDWERLKNGL
jgi:AmpD protein